MGTWSFGYDPLNRLTSATTTKSISNGNYDYCWTYDQYGNRTGQFGSNEAFVVGSPTCQPAPTPGTLTTNTATYNASNQMTQTNAPGTTVQPSYDPTGDITNDGSNQYVYDAEGRVCAVYQIPIGGVTNGWTGYVYDAAGNRVGKGNITNWNGTCDTTTNGFVLTSQYLLGPSGEQMTELNAAGAWVHTNVMANGSLIATFDNDNQGAHFYLTDWLGTRRVQTNYIGAVENTWASLPYGDALAPSNNLDPTEQHFTGKERDTESGNDYFGARYYSSAMGRFMSPDWSLRVQPVPYAKLENPQSLNLYGYVGSNPLSRTDPTGHYTCTASQDNCTKIENARLNDLQSKNSAVVAAAQIYGKPTDKNGVFVGVGEANGGNKTDFGRKDNGAGKADGTVVVTLDPETLKNQTLLDSQVGHEGSHVEDDIALIKSGYAMDLDITHRQTEQNAYKIGDLIIRDEIGKGFQWMSSPEEINKFIDSDKKDYPNPDSRILSPVLIPSPVVTPQ
jgi:RHS repeat-associated protein